MAKRTTTVFDTMLALYDLLEAQDWPGHDTTSETPLVYFGDVREVLDQGVFINGVLPEAANQEWKTLGNPSKDEAFTLRVSIGSRIVGQERREAVLRIRDLHAVVETALRDQTTGHPTGGFVAAVGGVQYMEWAVRTTTPMFGPLLDGGEGAWVDIDVAFKARI